MQNVVKEMNLKSVCIICIRKRNYRNERYDLKNLDICDLEAVLIDGQSVNDMN